jgi:hypothetical protein
VTEERKTSSTGGQKGQKLARFDLVAFTWLWEVATVCGFGAKKYDDDNWRKGYSWRLSYGAMQRHLSQFWTGENYDEESGLHHLAHAAWHCMVLFVFSTVERYTVFDDRPDTSEYRYGPQPNKANGCCAPSVYTNDQGDVKGVIIKETEKAAEYYGLSEVLKVDEDKCETFLRTECLMGHEIKFIAEDEGYIDGVRRTGTNFTSQVQLYREGYEYIDDRIAAQHKASCEQPAT